MFLHRDCPQAKFDLLFTEAAHAFLQQPIRLPEVVQEHIGQFILSCL